MIDKLKLLISKTYHLKDKIAFYPSIIALFGILLAYFMLFLEEKGITKYLLEYIPDVVVNNTETSRSLLTTFIGGLISIMVFSFSMVMILLNQASSNFSPRLLPELISNRRHQLILGFYISTIVYCIFILVSIEENSNEYQLPGFSVLIAIALMLHCLASFIYFIHSISQEIQINNIMDKILNTAKRRLNRLIDSEDDTEVNFPDSTKFHIYKATKSGYITNIALKNIADIAKKNDSKIKTIGFKGSFIIKNQPLFKSEKKLNEDCIKDITNQFEYSTNELIDDNYVLAFKQLTEIAVKAMSPGINDPGTALNAIDYLSELFSIRLLKSDYSYTKIEDVAWVNITSVNFSTLLYQVMASLRTYCKRDISVVQNLIKMLQFLKEIAQKNTHKEAIDKELELLKGDINSSITNKEDLKFLNELF
ncbi:DUF2254 domain-containing protein [Aurantibacter aestuarii]|uniref:DUF2254 domain-containing protein n=1 Tax=Aurantibacter aestuarii TaxID=1266046 RepID=A0A2T1N8B0_9FLAO|nr:DUF2254 domain-containing protein [Aurantibacter aestuarii]PSG88105.1 DUF2254 domain-containing protein [Aurantibacter aestuarii]